MTKSSKRLIFLGTRSAMKEVVWLAEQNGFEVLGALDDHYIGNTAAEQEMGIKILGSQKSIANNQLDIDLKSTYFFVASFFAGMNTDGWSRRHEMISIVKKHDLECATLIDPVCRISPDVEIGQNCLICFGVFIGTGCKIGNFSTLCPSAMMADHAVLEENVILNGQASIAYGVTVKTNAYLGPNSTVGRIGLRVPTIGKNSIIAACSAIHRDVPDNKIILPNGKTVDNIKANADELDNYVSVRLVRQTKSE